MGSSPLLQPSSAIKEPAAAAKDLSKSIEPDGFSTRAIHIGSAANSETGAVIPPISLSTTYKQDAIGVHKGYEYTRSDNPNRKALEEQLSSIEAGGGTAIALASGSAATALFLSALPSGSHVLSVNDVYGGTARFLTQVANSVSGIRTSFVDLDERTDEELLGILNRESTSAIWIESPTNPTLRVIDIPRIVRLARQAPSHPLVLADNTFMSPFYQSPLLLGADVVLHSITKYINGHSDVLMGALILPPASSLDRETSSPLAFELESKLRFLQNAYGSVPGNFDSWLTQRGAKTLALRMKAHGTNALAIARWLDGPGRALGLVRKVFYPGLRAAASRSESAEEKRRVYQLVRNRLMGADARRWVDRGVWEGGERPGEEDEGVPFGGMVSFEIAEPSAFPPAGSDLDSRLSVFKPDSDEVVLEKKQLRVHATAAERFLTRANLFTLAESLGGIESLFELPAAMTHAGIPQQQRDELGISSQLIRMSVGIEDVGDLLADLERALRWAVFGEMA